LLSSFATAGEWSGYFAQETRLFTQSPAYSGQENENLSLVFRPEYFHEWTDRREAISIKPFIRLDQHDDRRTHIDLRELYWEKVFKKAELRVGIDTVFWGTTESVHLVDIINQTDLVDRVDGEAKLGQPMINLSFIRSWGTLDLFALPGFRERTFPGESGRFRPPIPIDTDSARYESSAEELHVDWAIRWEHSLGNWDVGLSHFFGTNREPQLLLRPAEFRSLNLVPYYDQIHQTGLDAQYTRGGWLWKLESIVRSGQEETFAALVGGFEYTFYGVWGGAADVGVLAEYQYDERGMDGLSPFDNDLFLGTRIALNDTQSSDLLLSTIIDLDTAGTIVSLEASRRLGSDWRLSVEARAFVGLAEDDPAYWFGKDDYVQVELAWFF
jgi:hypothetical protein